MKCSEFNGYICILAKLYTLDDFLLSFILLWQGFVAYSLVKIAFENEQIGVSYLVRSFQMDNANAILFVENANKSSWFRICFSFVLHAYKLGVY